MQVAGAMVAMKAGEENDRSKDLKSKGLNPWTSVQRKSIVQTLQKSTLLEANHHATRRAGRSHAVVRVPSLSSIPDRRQHMVGFNEAVQLVVRGLWWPVRLEEPELSRGHRRQHGPQ